MNISYVSKITAILTNGVDKVAIEFDLSMPGAALEIAKLSYDAGDYQVLELITH